MEELKRLRERSRPIVQRLLERESAFCSGRCAAESEKRLADALFRVAVASLSPDPMLPRTFELP